MPRIERLQQNTRGVAPLAATGTRRQRRSGHHGRGGFQDAAHAVVDKDRPHAGRRGRAGGTARARTGAARAANL